MSGLVIQQNIGIPHCSLFKAILCFQTVVALIMPYDARQCEKKSNKIRIFLCPVVKGLVILEMSVVIG